MTQLTFIGIGAMGEPMVANLLRKNFSVTVLKHRRPEPAARLQALGAKIATTPAEAAAGSSIAILCLPTSREVEACVHGEQGLAQTMAAGSVIIDCSTSNQQSTRELAALLVERKIGLVDAGMTRGVAGAKQGNLAFFIGGEQPHIDQAMPALKAMGDTFLHLGPVGNGHTVKVISNILSYGTVALVNEALMLGARHGVDSNKTFEALMLGAPSKALEAFGPRIISGEYSPPRVTVDHVCEDMMLGQALATRASAPIFMLGAAQESYRLLALRGLGEQDISSIAELWRAADAK
jgi:3-hydroxyisobutyrate dehydrogenase-like beta-hydroxyacid dehydrogenase